MLPTSVSIAIAIATSSIAIPAPPIALPTIQWRSTIFMDSRYKRRQLRRGMQCSG